MISALTAARVRWPLGFVSAELVAGGLLILTVLGPLLLAPALGMPDPVQVDLSRRLQPPLTQGHVLGTDELGRDFLSRLVWGGRSSVMIGVGAVVASGLLGLAVGIAAGFRGGVTDTIASRLIEVQLSIPTTMLLLLVIAILGSSVVVVVGVLALANWVVTARLSRAMTLVEREKLYVAALRSMGASHVRILLRHILPNIFRQLLVIAMLQLASALLLESALSFLGFGVQRPFPTWGRILADGRPYVTSAPWLVVLPGLAISLLVLGVNLVGGRIYEAVSGDRS
jgi:peptide/nickel transport system permease protein